MVAPRPETRARAHTSLDVDLFSDYIWSAVSWSARAVHGRSDRRCITGLSSQIKPISYLKAHAAEIVRNLGEQREPLIITQNGEAKAVIQDIASYEQAQETLALLKILALGNRQIEEGKVHPAGEVIERLRERLDSA